MKAVLTVGSNINRDADLIVSVQVFSDDAGTTPLNISTVANIGCIVHQDPEEVQRFSKNAATGFKLLRITGGSSGQFQIDIDRAKLRIAREKKMYLDIRINQTNVNFSSGLQETIISYLEIGNISANTMEGVTLP